MITVTLPFVAARQRAVWRDNHHNRTHGITPTPGYECAYEFGDCTASKCCVSPSLLCMRRHDFHAAQCRSEQTACTPWEDRRASAGAHDWLCPGWEVCGGAWGGCTASRCCADASFGCYLNQSLDVARYMNRSDATLRLNRSHRVQWFAQCRQTNLTKCATSRLHPVQHGATGWTGAATLPPAQPDTNGGNRSVATTQEWMCPLSWMEWEDALWVAIKARSGSAWWLYPPLVVARYLASAVAATLVVATTCWGIAGLHRMQVFAQLRRESSRGEAREAVGDDDARRREQETSAVMSRLRTHAARAKRRQERQEGRHAEQAGLVTTAAPESPPSRGRCTEHELVLVNDMVNEYTGHEASCHQGTPAAGSFGDSRPSGDEVQEGERRAPGRRWGMLRWRSGDSLFSLLKGV